MLRRVGVCACRCGVCEHAEVSGACLLMAGACACRGEWGACELGRVGCVPAEARGARALEGCGERAF